MKEAAGEANMTVITIVLIAIVLGVGTLIVTNLMKNTEENAGDLEASAYDATTCGEYGGTWDAGTGTCDL